MPPPSSKREQILEKLKSVTLPAIVAGSQFNLTVKTVERGRRAPTELDPTTFPALFIVSTHEKSSNLDTHLDFESTLEVILLGYVFCSAPDLSAGQTRLQQDLGKFIQDVRNALEADPLLGNLAKWMEITEVTTDEGDILPYGGFVLSVRYEYVDRRGAS